MKLITRRILFCICFIIFLISSPLIILYAFGYRYDFAQKKIMQTGIIYLSPNIQDNIKILINDKEELNKISVKGLFKKEFVLYNLIPRTYNIKIEKENYHRWEKNLVVLPGLITYAQPLLLPSDPKINLIFNDINIDAWSLSDSFKKIFYLKNDEGKISANIYDFSRKTLVTKSISELNNSTKKINITAQNYKSLYAPDGKKFGFILSQDTERIILLNSSDGNISLMADFISADKITNGQWDNSSRYFLYLNAKGELNSYDTITEKTNKIFENILGFSLNGENIYYLSKDNLFLYRSSVNTPYEKQQLSYVPLGLNEKKQNTEETAQMNTGENTKILISAKNTLAVITPLKNLYIILQNGNPINIGNNIESAVFSKDGENLVFNSSFEIFTYEINSGQENLLTRLSQKISNVGWHESYTHVWFLTNQTIKNIELDSRPTPNIIDFVSVPNESASILYTDANFIYYDQLENNNLKLYQVEIQK